jgi:hypothetical protein
MVSLFCQIENIQNELCLPLCFYLVSFTGKPPEATPPQPRGHCQGFLFADPGPHTTIPATFFAQVQWQMFVTGAAATVMVSLSASQGVPRTGCGIER